MLWWDDIDGPHGPMRAVLAEGGLARLTLPGDDADAALARLASARGARAQRDARRLDAVRGELDAYFAGTLRRFTLAVDLDGVPAFRREVLEAMRGVPYGATVSYAELAALAGRPRAVRAAGTACATNPVPVVVPCHRVLRTGGAVGAYGGGAGMKQALLVLEGALAPAAAPRA
ncbi:MAG TPA: methylated-DNA--[protein]-cysteine S-methyltransferase [Miltoncostaeaceae bacterium]|nr:methylated-DNA--[protein]-cysteine S-methyltransferase [Miltoncostaeaceae bacterium]